MKVFITGASGFIGSGIAQKLAEQGFVVHALVRNPSSMPSTLHANIRFFKGDVNDPVAIERAMAGCTEVYHCAAYARLWASDRNYFYKVNVEGTTNILEQAMRSQVRKLVFTSSTAVLGPSIGRPICETDPRVTSFDTDYELSKLMAEQQVKTYVQKGLNCVIVNPSRVYGPGPLSYSNAIARFLLRLLKGQMVVMPGVTDVVANYVFIDDVIDGHIKAMQYGMMGERYILGGENISYRQLLNLVKPKFSHPHILPLPLTVMKLAGYFELVKSTITGGLPHITPVMLDRYFKNAAFSSNKAEIQLGYRITPLGEGIDKTISYLKNYTHE